MKRTILVLFALLVPVFSYGQLLDSSLSTQPTLSTEPQNPEPGETIQVRINNFYTAGNASVSWFVNGEEILNAQNRQVINVALDSSGEKQAIRAVINSPTLGLRTLDYTVSPVYLDILFDAQTHVPDFYEGRALPSAVATVNATALLFGQNLPESNLFYSWKVDGKNINGGSGIGQNQVSFITSKSWSTTISLEVSTVSGQAIASKSVSLPNVKPYVLFYEVNSLYGTQPRPLSSFNLIGNSATVLAEPYYLDSTTYNNPGNTTWNLDGFESAPIGNPYELTFERTRYDGSADLSFTVRSLSNLLQVASDEITVNY